MRKLVKVAVEMIGQWGPSKYDEYAVMVVAVKDIESGRRYKLNLSKKYENTVNRWLPNIKLGNILECTLKDSPKDRIDHFAPYKIIEVKGQKKEANPDAVKISLALQLEKIESTIQAIKQDFNIEG